MTVQEYKNLHITWQ